MKTTKHTAAALCLTVLLCCLLCVPVWATGTGDVASAVENTWKTASGQIKTVVNNVVFPAIDLILRYFSLLSWECRTLTTEKVASSNGRRLRSCLPVWCLPSPLRCMCGISLGSECHPDLR